MNRFSRLGLFLLCGLVGAGGPASVAAANPSQNPAAGDDPNAAVRRALQAELEDFSKVSWDRRTETWAENETAGLWHPAAGPALTEYRSRLKTIAGWSQGPVWHQAGTLALVKNNRPAEALGVNVFIPAGPTRGTVLFVHGYMSHSANFAYTAAYLTARGWIVTTLDLPGHGLSTGARADVDSFATYGDAVKVWMDWAWAQKWPGTKVLLAHSLGSAASFEALRRTGTPRPDRVVFCAPLLRPDWYPLLSLGEAAVGWWIQEVPSTFGWDGYLDGYVMPIHWFQALGRWLTDLETQTPVDLPLTIFSGDRDTVVDEGWNRSEYRRLVPRAEYVTLPGKGHLFLTGKKDREPFHRRLAALLETP